jgi:hypothetical protein
MKIVCQRAPFGEKFAPKYCFKASCKLVHTVNAHVLGSFVSYEKTPEVVHDVYVACQVSLPGFPEGYECCPDVDLYLLDECPVECVREVKFIPEETP